MIHKAFFLIGLAASFAATPELFAQVPATPPASPRPTAGVACVAPLANNDHMTMDHTTMDHTTMDHGTVGDSTFAALQQRGGLAMGVDQYTSAHRFDILPDGGRIELQRDADDPEDVEIIREHLKNNAAAFARGDFCTPAFVHGRQVPGTAALAAHRNAITYTFNALPRGGEVRITTADPVALEAIRAFMSFQRSDHREGGVGHE